MKTEVVTSMEISMKDSIIIHKSASNGNDKNKKILSKEELKRDTLSHITDVQKSMMFIIKRLLEAADKHDHTKLENFNDFYKDFHEAQLGNVELRKSGWYNIHTNTERHHLNERIPDDVNLIDIIEMVCDGCMAGLARSGSVYPMIVDNDLLQKALKNTCNMLIENTKVIE